MNTLGSYLWEYRLGIRNGFLIILGFSAVLLMVMFSLSRSNFNNAATARLEIEVGGQKRAFEGEVLKNMTVLEALQASAAAGNISFSYKLDNGRLVIERIDGYRGPVESILVFLNSTLVKTETINVLPVNPGDVIAVKIQK